MIHLKAERLAVNRDLPSPTTVTRSEMRLGPRDRDVKQVIRRRRKIKSLDACDRGGRGKL
jgi:hypothetical protein